jgi:alpha-galactosidase
LADAAAYDDLRFDVVAEIEVDPHTALIYEHGWQSWSPSLTYRVTEAPYRPTGDRRRIASYRPEARVPDGTYQGLGLLAVQPAAGAPVHLFGIDKLDEQVPAVRAEVFGQTAVISAARPVRESIHHSPRIDTALARWADAFAVALDVPPIRPAPVVWCSWYHYYASVTEADVDENLRVMDELDIPVDVVQVDDGWQRAIGDWLPPTRFADVPLMSQRIRATGRRVGLWLAPFLAGSESDLYQQHPEWVLRDAAGTPVNAGYVWEQDIFGLDLTRPDVLGYLADVFGALRDSGVDYFKIDFLFAGSLAGRRHDDVPALVAYRNGLRVIREQIGDAYLVGCGAPLLASVGLVDAMRVSPDTGPSWKSTEHDLAEAGGLSSVLTGAGRAWQHGRFWINDPDCLIVRPRVERRAELAAHIERFGGLRASSDRLLDLDDWGLATTRRLLSTPPGARFVD